MSARIIQNRRRFGFISFLIAVSTSVLCSTTANSQTNVAMEIGTEPVPEVKRVAVTPAQTQHESAPVTVPNVSQKPQVYSLEAGLESTQDPKLNAKVEKVAAQERLPLGKSVLPAATKKMSINDEAVSTEGEAGMMSGLKKAYSGWGQTIAALIVVLSLIFAIKLFVLKAQRRQGGGKRLGAIEVLSRNAISPKNSVLLLRVGGKVLVVAEGAQGLSTLSEINEPRELATLMVQAGKSGKTAAEFSHLLSELEGNDDALLRDQSGHILSEGLPERSSLLSKFGLGGKSARSARPVQQTQSMNRAVQRAHQTQDQVSLSNDVPVKQGGYGRPEQRLGPSINPRGGKVGASQMPPVSRSGKSPEEIQKLLSKVRQMSRDKASPVSEGTVNQTQHINQAA